MIRCLLASLTLLFAASTALADIADLREDVPFSFVYDGKPSSELLSKWKVIRTKDQTVYTDPATGLVITCTVRSFGDDAIEWVVTFRNILDYVTPVLEKILPLDMPMEIAADDRPVLHYSKGSTVGPAGDDFAPLEKVLEKPLDRLLLPGELDKRVVSQAWLPYFTLQKRGGGIVGAIGWTGQWKLEVSRTSEVQLRVCAGQELTHLRLHPQEQIRTPRILLVSWKGDDSLVGQNRFRRVLIDHYLPRQDGEVEMPAVAMHDITHVLDVPPADQQIKDLERMARLGAECYWIDASWFPGDFRYDVGSWHVRQDLFPQGLRPISDRAHALGMKFLVWCEPERVGTPRADLAKEHPQWILSKRDPGWIDPETGWPGHPEEMLFNLGDESARKWMTDFISSRIKEWGIDVWREDRNFRPVRYWRANDPPDRQGITENFYVQGFYRMWDELLRRHPKLVIDSCNWRNTGPDIEVLSRSAGAWTQSEVADCGRSPVANQVHSAGLSVYVPVHTNLCYSLDPYAVRSESISGICFGLRMTELLDPSGKNDGLARKAIAEVKRLRPFALADFYPLTPIDVAETHFAAWQFNRPKEGDGYAVFFRRAKCAGSDFRANLRGLDRQARYKVDFYASYELRESRQMSGDELAQLVVQIDRPNTSLLVQYQRQ